MLMRSYVLLIALLVTVAPARADTILFVDDDAPPDGDGLTWETAYRFLADALTAARERGGDATEIRVGQGVYLPDRDEMNPDGTGDRTATFQLHSGVSFLGGYAGLGADDPDARDVARFETILSGDLAMSGSLRSYHVITVADAVTGTTIDGFFVINGEAAEPLREEDQIGGGMLVTDSTLTVRHCAFYDNRAGSEGGAIFSRDSDLELDNCSSIDNEADQGAVIYNDGGELTITACTFESNVAVRDGGAIDSRQGPLVASDCEFVGNQAGRDGGAIANRSGDAVFTNCLFESNRAAVDHAFIGHGGAIEHDGWALVVQDCDFHANTAGDGKNFEGPGTGGAIYCWDDPVIIEDSRFEANVAGGWGGAVYLSHSEASIVRCQFTSNRALLSAGGGLYSDGAEVNVDHSAFFDNEAAWGGGAASRNSGGQLEVNTTVFRRNRATAIDGSGGAINVRSNTIVTSCVFAENSAPLHGGAISTGPTTASVAASRFVQNTASSGGAVYGLGSEQAFSGCLFSENVADLGGAIALEEGEATLFRNCAIGDNVAATGGGIWAHKTNLTMIRCTIGRNIAEVGGGSYLTEGQNLIIATQYIANEADLGGAIYHLVQASSTMLNCLFNGNLATSEGAAIYDALGALSLVNCTAANNVAGQQGGAVLGLASSATLLNCNLWANAPDQVIGTASSTINVSFGNIEGGWTGDGIGNIDADPLFVDPFGADGVPGTEDDDLRLSTGSPCIDAAFNNAVPADVSDLDDDGDLSEFVPFDLDGEPRFADDLKTDDTGCGAPAIVDMGAYEFPGIAIQPVRGDITGDLLVDGADLVELLGSWGECPAEDDGEIACCAADLNADGAVDPSDLLILLGNWG